MSEWAHDVGKLLADGLYLHNLRAIVEHCDRGLKEEGAALLPAHVIRSVISDLHREWEGRAASTAARRARASRRPWNISSAPGTRSDRGGPRRED
jgi:hypothetical protein